MGWITPVSLLASMTETSIPVPGLGMALQRRVIEVEPHAPARIDRQHFDAVGGEAVAAQHGGMLDRASPAARRRRAAPRRGEKSGVSASVSASVPQEVKTTPRGIGPDQRRHPARAVFSFIARAERPTLAMHGRGVAGRVQRFASSGAGASGRIGEVALWSR